MMNQQGLKAGDQWSISAEERRNYDKQFDQLGSSGGFLRGDQAKGLFLKSSLSPAVLGRIWELADMTRDGKMDKQEFAIAMKLIRLKRQGEDLPKSLPLSLKRQPASFDISAFAQTSLKPSSTLTASVFDAITSKPQLSSGTAPTAFSSNAPATINLLDQNPPANQIGLGMPGISSMAPHAGNTMMLSGPRPMGISGFVPVGNPMPGTSLLGTAPAPTSLMSTPPARSTLLGSAPAPVALVNTPPASGNASSDWAIPKQSKLKYNQLFNMHDSGKAGSISGMQGRYVLTQTGLPEPILAQIWNLSDIDNDGRLTQEEFVLAMHFTDVAKSGGAIPTVLPPDMIPPSYRRAAAGAIGNGIGANVVLNLPNLLDKGSIQDSAAAALLFSTFEDKRRDNFNKGNIELERRRLALEESQRKERERIENKEREERERRERERFEQEKKRQIQLERQLELQQAAEREKEEALKKAIEQREAAQREMERQRRMEFERLRRQELLQQKLREQEAVTSLHAKTKELDVEIAALGEKTEQLGGRVSELQAREREQKVAVGAMSRSLESKRVAVSQRQNELKDLRNRMDMILPEKRTIFDRASSGKENGNRDFNSSLKMTRDSRHDSIQGLRRAVEKNQREAASKLVQLEELNVQLNHLREEWNKHRLEVEAMHRLQQDKVLDLQQSRRAKEASIRRQQQKNAAMSHFKMKEATMEKAVAVSEGEKQKRISSTTATTTTTASTTQATSVFDTKQSAEDEVKREDVRRRIAEMQQKRLEQKKMTQEPMYATFDKTQKLSSSANADLPVMKNANLSQFRALYIFQARNPDELTINCGDIVMVDEKEDAEPGWYSGTLNGKKGYFPTNYVEKISSAVENISHKDFIAPPEIRPPPQSSKPTKSSPLPDTIQSSDASAFTLASRTHDASPVPGQGQKTSNLKCRALYPWQAKKDNHLTFEKDSIIEVSEQQAMWWFGTWNEKSGWFPKAYVKEVKEVPAALTVNGQAKASSPSMKRKAPEPPKAAQTPPAGKEYVASYTFASQEKGDLSFEAGERIVVTEIRGDWWSGTCGGRSGIFPANYVVLKEQSPATVAAPVPCREIADVIAPYSATQPNQLSLTKGQLVLIKKKSDSGWWEGELQVRGKKKQVGWFPENYVKVRTPGQVQAKVKTLCQVMAMYDYAAQNDDEISFPRGTLLNVTDKSDADWWKGYPHSNPNSHGLFPNNYVREISQSEASGAAQWTLEQNTMSSDEIRRQQHIHELIVSEESYLKDLEMANNGFQIPLKESNILTEQEMNTLFVNWNELILCNAKLVKAFRVRRKNSGDGALGAVVSLIGDVLCEQLSHLQPYVRFCSCQLNASTLLQEKIDSNPEFKKLVKACESGSNFKGLPVSSYLVKPMQRITKYPLLIQKILKHTPENHVDHNHLKLALERAEELCSQVNEGVRQKENADRLEWLQTHTHLEGIDKLVFNSATNCLGQRRYLHCGALYKHKSNKELVGFLFNDFLLLTTPTKPLNMPVNDFIFSSKSNPQFRLYKMPIFLNEVLIRLPTDPSPTGNNSTDEDVALFHLSHVDRVYTLRAENVNERTAWTSKIKSASQLYIETEKKKREKAYHARSQRTAGIGRLMVNIVEGCNLVKSTSGRNDPYCEVTMGVQSHTTKTVPDTLNPKWGTSMQFFVKNIMQDVLCISVFQRDMFSPDDFLGRTEIKVVDIKKDIADNKGPLTKRLLLHEVDSGEVVVKVDLQLFGNETKQA